MHGSWLTYPETGATVSGEPLPAGYRHVVRRQVIGRGRTAFERASAALLSWRVHREAGVAVLADGRMRPGQELRVRFGWGRLSVGGPCRIVAVVDEPDCRGFAYGTLPGHPECGEEAFLVEIEPDGTVVAQVRGFSLPGTRLTRAAGPVAALVQDVVTARYLDALADAAAEAA